MGQQWLIVSTVIMHYLITKLWHIDAIIAILSGVQMALARDRRVGSRTQRHQTPYAKHAKNLVALLRFN